MGDIIHTDGFPPRWSMVERPDCTLLVRHYDFGPFGGGTAICAAPRLQQGKAWLATARQIARAVAGMAADASERREAEFCDSCATGPICDEDGVEHPNNRALQPWVCDRCGHHNARPKMIPLKGHDIPATPPKEGE